MKIGVISSRARRGKVYENDTYVIECLKKLVALNKGDEKIEIISGGGKGPETFAMEFAEREGYEITKIPPRIKVLGARAFTERNRSIATECDILAVFWAGEDPNIPAALSDAVILEKQSMVFPI